MKIGVTSSSLVFRYGVDGTFELIKKAGFDAVDFNFDVFYTWKDIKAGAPCELLTVREKIDSFTDEINAAAKKHGLVINQMHAVFPIYFKDRPDYTESVYNTLVGSIEICGRVGCKLLVIHPGFCGYLDTEEMQKKEWEINMQIYTSLIPLLDKWGVTCCLENMWVQDPHSKKIYGAICSDADEACAYIDALNEKAGKELFGFCFDIGHALIIGSDPYLVIKKLGKRLKTLHIHDNDGHGDDHLCPYMGIGDWARFCRALKEADYKGCLSFETGNTQSVAFTPEELWLPTLRLTAEVGRYFAKQIEG